MTRISIIGLGLIGGSIAKSLKKNDENFYINAYDKQEVLNLALKEKCINAALKSPEESLESDIIFLCLPVELSLSIFENLAPKLQGNILTDVCGVKGVFEDKWNSVNSNGFYFGGHPMTGKEKGGYENADPLLFENSVYILSDRIKNVLKAQDLINLISLLGARITFLDPYIHDKVVANVSHLPQLLSVALVNTAAVEYEGINFTDFAAGGFRDMTRIASSDFNIWKSILKLNKREILTALSSFQDQVEYLKKYLDEEKHDAVYEMFKSSAQKRDGIPKNTKGFLSPLFDLFVYVKDQPGNISKISTGLFNAGINIKDIELLKIREGSGGTFRVSFESENDVLRARNILSKLGFISD